MHLIRPLRILPAPLGREMPLTAFLLGPDQPHGPSWWQPPLVPHGESCSRNILLLVFGWLYTAVFACLNILVMR